MHQKSLLPSSWELPEVFRHRLGESAGRQRAMAEDGHLLIVLHGVPGPDDEVREGHFFWRKPDGSWVSTTGSPGQTSIDVQLDAYEKVIAHLDQLETAAQSADDYFEVLKNLAPIVRASRNQQAALQSAREKVPGDRKLINYRDRAYTLERQADLLASDAKNALDYAIARRAEEQAKASEQMAVSAHRLNILAAFFFPLATISGLLGMDVKTGIDRATVNSYLPLLGSIGLGLFAGVLLTVFVLGGRKPK